MLLERHKDYDFHLFTLYKGAHYYEIECAIFFGRTLFISLDKRNDKKFHFMKD